LIRQRAAAGSTISRRLFRWPMNGFGIPGLKMMGERPV
jgi:hypothetical protein